MNSNILITGRPGSGKSTLILKLIERFAGRRIAGIVTPEIRRADGRYGFKIIDIASGAEEILASIDIDSAIRVSKYYVNVAGIDKIVDAFMRGLDEAEILMIDEIGKMELFSEKFRAAVLKILDVDKPVVATIAQSDHPFLDKVRRWGDIEIIDLGRTTPDRAVEEIAADLERRLPRKTTPGVMPG